MRILAIETSCDETAVSYIEAAGGFEEGFRFRILGQALYSQIAIHAQYGGVFPNLAKREHAANLVPLLTKALTDAGSLAIRSEPLPMDAIIPLREILARESELLAAIIPFLLKHEKPAIDCIAVTHGPGLEPALWVGVNFARALARAWDVPVVPVNHMEGHIILPMMEMDAQGTEGVLKPVGFPLVSLLVSGGHTEIVLSPKPLSYEVLGQTRDDAAGEAFDKVARLLGLPYPGGPEISRLAALARTRGIPHGTSFTRPMMNADTFDFSFSGLKTAARRVVEERSAASGQLTDDDRMDIAREFEDTVVDVLVHKTMRAVERYGASTVLVGGGVSANTRLREALQDAIRAAYGDSVSYLLPHPSLATDNALMIALAGFFRAREGAYAEPDTIRAHGTLPLT